MQKLGYNKLEPFKSSHTKDKLTNEQRFWKKYQTKPLSHLNNPISAISSNHNTQQSILYSYGRTLHIYDTTKSKVLKEISTFADTITSLCMRPDGAVMAIGLENGLIEIIDTKEKFHLRTFRNHKKRINALEYRENDLYSGGDDFVLRHFDVAAGEVVHSYADAHSDYIKSIKALEDNHILSAGYDGYVRLFDFRVHEKAQLEFHHQEQLEAIDVFPSGMIFAAVGGNKMSLWDVRTGKGLFEARNNKKIVSGVRVVSQGSRFMTSSYDNYLKIYQADTFELTYMEKMPASIQCFDVTANNLNIFLGLEGGLLYEKSRSSKTSEAETGDEEDAEVQNELMLWLKRNEEKKFAYNDQYFYRGIYQKADTFDIKFQQNQSKKVSQYDSFLKKFQYKQALLTSLEKHNMMIYLSLVDEYIQRGCLERTIASLTNEQIEALLGKVLPLIHNPKYARTSLYLLQTLIEQHPHSTAWKSQVLAHVNEELETIATMAKLDGLLELVENNFE